MVTNRRIECLAKSMHVRFDERFSKYSYGPHFGSRALGSARTRDSGTTHKVEAPSTQRKQRCGTSDAEPVFINALGCHYEDPKAAVLLLFQSSTAIVMLTTLLDLLAACLHPHHPADTLVQLCCPVPTSLIQELTNIFLSSRSLENWHSLTVAAFPPFCDLNTFKKGLSRHFS